MSPCSKADLIARLSDLSESDYVEFETHLSQCAFCRAAFDHCCIRDGESERGSVAVAATDGSFELIRPLPLATDYLARIRRARLHLPTGDTRGAPAPMPQDTPVVHDAVPGSPPPLERYELLQEIGRGGFGVVYRARDRRLDMPVAVKVITLPGSGAPREHERLLREAKFMSGIQHPHVVRVLDVLSVDKSVCIVMELVEGESLAVHMQGEKSPSPRDAAVLIAQVAEALDAVHRVGVVHGDVTPRNILLSSQTPFPADVGLGRLVPKLADFGLARRTTVHSSHADNLPAGSQSGTVPDGPSLSISSTGTLMGTPNYISPEQCAGHPPQPRSDIFSIGVVLYELLAGDRLFEGDDTLAVLQDVQTKVPAPPSRVNVRLHRDLDAITLKCLSREPDKRYATAGDLAADLHRFLQNEPVQARRVRTTERMWLWARRRPAHAALVLAATALLCSAMGFVSYYAYSQDQRAHAATEYASQVLERKRSGDRLIYVGKINQAQRSWFRFQPQLTLQLLDKVRPENTDGGLDYRGWEWNYLKRLCHSEKLLMRGHTGEVRCISYSPDGSLVASGSRDCTARLWDAGSGQTRYVLEGHFHAVTCLAFSPDGKTLATGSEDATVKLWDAATGRELATLNGHILTVNSVAFHPQGKLLATAASDETIQLYELPENKLVRILQGHNGPVSRVVFRHDGKQLASAGFDSTIRIWSPESGEELRVLKGNTSYLSYGPGGRRLMFDAQGLRIVDADTGAVVCSIANPSVKLPIVRADISHHLTDGRTVTKFAPLSTSFHEAVFSPDGTRICTSIAGSLQIWDVATGRELSILRGQSDVVAWSPDGVHLLNAGTDNSIRMRSVIEDPDATTLIGHRNRVSSLTFSPDGNHLASGSEDHSIRIWNIALGVQVGMLGIHRFEMNDSDPPALKTVVTFAGHNEFVRCVAYSPDGRWLASASHDRTLRVWETGSGKEVLTLEFAAAVSCVTWSPDGQRLAAGSWDDRIHLFAFPSGQPLRKFPGHVPFNVSAVAFMKHGRILASAGWDNSVRIWDVETGELLRVLTGTHLGYLTSLSVSSDDQLLAAAGREMVITIWETASWTEVRKLWGHNAAIDQVVFSPNGPRLLSVGEVGKASSDLTGSVKLWDATTGLELLELPGAFAAAFSRDGRRIATSLPSNAIRVYDSAPVDNQPYRTAPLEPPQADVVKHGDDGTVHVLGYFTAQRLAGIYGAPPVINTSHPGREFLVAVISLPIRFFVPTAEQYAELIREDGAPSPSPECNAVFEPARFGLRVHDADWAAGEFVGWWPTHDAPGFNSRIRLIDTDPQRPHERVALAIAWSVDPKDIEWPIQVRIDEDPPVALPGVRLVTNPRLEPPPQAPN